MRPEGDLPALGQAVELRAYANAATLAWEPASERARRRELRDRCRFQLSAQPMRSRHTTVRPGARVLTSAVRVAASFWAKAPVQGLACSYCGQRNFRTLADLQRPFKVKHEREMRKVRTARLLWHQRGPVGADVGRVVGSAAPARVTGSGLLPTGPGWFATLTRRPRRGWRRARTAASCAPCSDAAYRHAAHLELGCRVASRARTSPCGGGARHLLRVPERAPACCTPGTMRLPKPASVRVPPEHAPG